MLHDGRNLALIPRAALRADRSPGGHPILQLVEVAGSCQPDRQVPGRVPMAGVRPLAQFVDTYRAPAASRKSSSRSQLEQRFVVCSLGCEDQRVVLVGLRHGPSKLFQDF